MKKLFFGIAVFFAFQSLTCFAFAHKFFNSEKSKIFFSLQGGTTGFPVESSDTYIFSPIVVSRINTSDTQAEIGAIRTLKKSSSAYPAFLSLSAGFAFNKYFSTELGFSVYGKAKWNATKLEDQLISYQSSASLYPPESDFTPEVSKEFTMSVYMMDLLVGGTYPFDNGFSVFAKGGVALADAKYKRPSLGIITYTSANRVYVLPKFVFGAGYDITKNINVNINYSYIVGRGNVKSLVTDQTSINYFPSMSSVSLGLTYSL